LAIAIVGANANSSIQTPPSKLDVGERLPVAVANDEACVGFLDGPGRLEAARITFDLDHCGGGRKMWVSARTPQNDIDNWGGLSMTKPVDTLKTIARYIEAKKPKTLGDARAGSATRLNAGSHPTGGCDLTATAGDETLEVRFSVSGRRSPLFVRLTETACCAVLAAPGVLTAAGSAPTIRPTAIATAITLLRPRGGEALLLDVEKLLSFLSISAPHCGGC
jgi:hypothetical protein